MSKRDKLIARVMRGQDVQFEEAQKLLESFGFVGIAKGSHHTFRKEDSEKITIVYRNPIHKDAVKEIAQIIKRS